MPKPMPRIGIDKLYYAKVISDTEEGCIYSAPKWLQGVNALSYNPNTQNASYDADDGTYVSFSADGEIQTTITVADLTPRDYADLMGLEITAEGLISEGENDNPPEVAIGFRSQKSNGEYRFVWVLKGKFSKQQEDYATKGGAGITYQPRTIMHTALKRTFDGKRRNLLDSDTDGLSLTLAQLSDAVNGWFSDPNFNPADYSASTPVSDLAAATGTTAGEIDVTWTAATGASNVAIQVSQGGEWSTVKNVAGTASSATITGLAAGKPYLVRLYVTGGTKAGISNIDSAEADS